MQVKVGDTVQLRSGSPLLVVTQVSWFGNVAKVQWFNDKVGYVFEDWFPTACLVERFVK